MNEMNDKIAAHKKQSIRKRVKRVGISGFTPDLISVEVSVKRKPPVKPPKHIPGIKTVRSNIEDNIILTINKKEFKTIIIELDDKMKEKIKFGGKNGVCFIKCRDISVVLVMFKKVKLKTSATTVIVR